MTRFFILILISASLFAQENEWLFSYIDTHPDFPIEGVDFKWYGRLLKDPEAFEKVISLFANRYRDSGIDIIACLDSRGFVFGSAIAFELKLPFILIRKKGKLPGEVYSIKYGLHYGKDCLELEKDALTKKAKVLIVDDVLATGGTSIAAGKLVEMAGGIVYETAFLEEIESLKGRELSPYPVFSLIKVEGR